MSACRQLRAHTRTQTCRAWFSSLPFTGESLQEGKVQAIRHRFKVGRETKEAAAEGQGLVPERWPACACVLSHIAHCQCRCMERLAPSRGLADHSDHDQGAPADGQC